MWSAPIHVSLQLTCTSYQLLYCFIWQSVSVRPFFHTSSHSLFSSAFKCCQFLAIYKSVICVRQSISSRRLVATLPCFRAYFVQLWSKYMVSYDTSRSRSKMKVSVLVLLTVTATYYVTVYSSCHTLSETNKRQSCNGEKSAWLHWFFTILGCTSIIVLCIAIVS